jgi:hypothetical protein
MKIRRFHILIKLVFVLGIIFLLMLANSGDIQYLYADF